MALNFNTLLFDSSRLAAELTADAVGNDPQEYDALIEFCLASKHPYSMRSARAVYVCLLRFPKLFDGYADKLLERWLYCEDIGIIRSFLKIYFEHVDLESLTHGGILLNKVFDWFSDSSVPIAKRIYSLDILEKWSKVEPDIKPELAAIAYSVWTDEKAPAVINRAAKAYKRLMKE